MNRPESVSRDAGFTMIELLTVLLVAIVLLLMSYPELMKYYIRGQMEGVVRETSFVLQRAKYRAIKNAQPVQICGDPDGGSVTGLGRSVELPDSVSLYEITVKDSNCFVFQPDGSVEKPGAFRFADVRGNFLEVGVDSKATARVQVRKQNETDGKWYTRDQGENAWVWKTGRLL